jgi:hypothetical protein
MRNALYLVSLLGLLSAGCGGDDPENGDPDCTTTCLGPTDSTSCDVMFPASCTCEGTTQVVEFYGCIDQCCDGYDDLSLQQKCAAAQVLCD